MYLVELGLTTAARNLGRNLLQVLATAIAALIMTGSLTVTQGYTPYRAAAYRAFLGGDVLVYPAWTWPSESDVAEAQKVGLEFDTLPPSFRSPLAYFHPNYYSDGYVTASPVEGLSMFGNPDELRRVEAVLRSEPEVEVEGVYPYEAVPVIDGEIAVAYPDGTRGKTHLSGSVLRLAPPGLLSDPGAPPGETPGRLPPEAASEITLVQGRWLSADDADLVAMVNRRAVIGRQALDAGACVEEAPAGQTIKLTLPRVARRTGGGAGGLSYADPSRSITLEFRVVGVYEVRGRVLRYTVDRTDYYESLFFEGPEILLPPAAFERVLTAMGFTPDDPPPVGALAVSLSQQATAEKAADVLRKSLPGYSVVTVAAEVTYAHARGLPEPIYEAPPASRPRRLGLTQPVVPAEARTWLGVLLFLFAGLVVAGNSLLVVVSRRTDLAILKAIGLGSWEVALVVLIEVVGLAALGLVIGYGAAELGSLPILLTNRVAVGTILRDAALHLAIVGPATLGASAVFAVAPMVRTLRITVMDTLRAE